MNEKNLDNMMNNDASSTDQQIDEICDSIITRLHDLVVMPSQKLDISELKIIADITYKVWAITGEAMDFTPFNDDFDED